MEAELDDMLAKDEVDKLRIALRQQTKQFNAVQRVVNKKEEEVKKCYDNLTTLAADFQLLEIVPSEVATTDAHQSSGDHSSFDSAEVAGGVTLP
jgi:hypothetical protein